jgi:predicted DNA-binding protein
MKTPPVKLSDKPTMTTSLRLRMPPAMLEALARVAAERGCSASAIVRHALLEHIREREERLRSRAV